MSCSKDHNSGGAVQAGGDARRLPGLHGSGAGGYPAGGQEHFSWEGQIWSSSTLNAIAVDLMAARDKHSAGSPPSRNVGQWGRRKPRGEEKARRADGEVGCGESRREGRRQGLSPRQMLRQRRGWGSRPRSPRGHHSHRTHLTSHNQFCIQWFGAHLYGWEGRGPTSVDCICHTGLNWCLGRCFTLSLLFLFFNYLLEL